MGNAASYWRLVRIDSRGQRRVEEIASAQAFFQTRFAHWMQQSDVPHIVIQRQLVQWLHDEQTQRDAEFCLRCYISNQIEQTCLQLATQFGVQHGFTCNDLLAFVLDDVGQSRSASATQLSNYRSLATDILQSFDPTKGNLSTWVMQRVRQQPDLNRFLLQQGVYLISDWAILNDTQPKQLHRIFSEFHNLTGTETQQAMLIVQSYHQVYRQDRLKSRLAGGKRQCVPPTPDQLQRMAEILQTANLPLSSESIRSRLQTIASYLRQYRIFVRSGTFSTQSLDQPEISAVIADCPYTDSDDSQTAEADFLKFYRSQFLSCLDHSLAQVVSDRTACLQRKRPPIDQAFLSALHAFHCKGQPMGDIAKHLGLQAQYQVTRLLKLKEFRADVRQQLLRQLGDRIRDRARDYADPDRLQKLDDAIEVALNEHIEVVLQQAEAETTVTKNQPLRSLFARRLCHHLETLRRITS